MDYGDLTDVELLHRYNVVKHEQLPLVKDPDDRREAVGRDQPTERRDPPALPAGHGAALIMRTRAAVAAVVGALLLAGCTAGSSPTSAPARTTVSTTTPTPTTTPPTPVSPAVTPLPLPPPETTTTQNQALQGQISQDQLTVNRDEGWVSQEQGLLNSEQSQEQYDAGQCSQFEQDVADPGPDGSSFSQSQMEGFAEEYCSKAQADSGQLQADSQNLQRAEASLQDAESQLQRDQAALS